MKCTFFALLVTMLVGSCFSAVPAATAQSDGPAMCASALATGSYGRYNVVLGSDGDDVLRGGSDNDLICGFGGNDRLVGGSGNDILVGGDGADDLRGGSGNDELHIDEADTRVKGGSGNNRIIAAPVVTGVTSIIFTPSIATAYCEVSVKYSGFPPFTNIVADLYLRDAIYGNPLVTSVNAELDGSGNGVINAHHDGVKGIGEYRVLGPGIDTGWVMTAC